MTRKMRYFLAGLSAFACLAIIVAVHFGLIPSAAGVIGLGGGAFVALTIPPSLPARNSGEQQLHFLRFRFQVGQVSAVAAGVKVGRLPARSFIHSMAWHKSTAFNSATTDTLQVGSTQAGVDLLAATTIQGAGYVNHTAAAGLGLVVTAETDVWIKYAQSGAVATAGDVTLVVAYLPDNDQ